SSGVDSSYIVATSNVQKTFTVGFDTGSHYNETTYAKALSDELGIEHHSKLISADEYFAALPGIQYHTDEPLADPAVMALHFVSVVAREHVRCVFSGEGPDEFFGGYHIYREPISLRHLTHLPKPLRKCLAWLARNLLPVGMKGRDFFIRGGMTVEERFVGNAKIFDDHERRKLLLRPTGASYTDVTAPYFARVQHLDDITKMQYVDIKLWLDGDILQGADKVPMSHSLEVRTPLLDKEIFAVAAKVPAKYRVSKTETKIVFRRAAQRKLPESVAQKRKLGFPVPIRVWLREDKYAAMVQAEFEGDTARQYFDTAALVKLIAQHRAGKFDHSRKIWTVYTFLLWHRAYF
ncbi:MAG: asparagine synthase C-terminal domain-containing protein, partial [Oscillospiraceae bacterium]|nr:asparagine synthase C-terminal domain-containing protein [Oscillospiraceae bacterium]